MRRIWPFKRGVDSEKHPHFPVAPNARPDFLCIGAPKGGTTWLYQQVRSHGDFWMPPLKELSYFDQMSRSRHPDPAARSNLCIRDERDRRFLDAMEHLCRQQHIDLASYAQLFSPKGSLLSGDISPGYCIIPEEIIACVVKYFPHLKVIFVARDPVERAWSDLSMAVRGGGICRFDVTDSNEVVRNLFHPDIVMRSYPSTIVARWRRHVRPELFGIYFFDDLERNPAEMRRSIFRFLGADPERPSGRVRVHDKINEGGKKLPLNDDMRLQIGQFFAEELKNCASDLGGPARAWPARYGL